ncbi:MAG: hypothetical protein KGJ89_00965 [Patescibacteria group bacterium]|nr:hypothetical protein [Patescibacteria group bacterium]MDE2015084.1 hypothetical protein [Patescibacteria group bacterium]MDE2226512.1 hypothetical protein [Patescibacteria group bacterium]
MIPQSIFKAYDIRGKYPDAINEENVKKIVGGLQKFFKKGKVVVARDARLSSPRLYAAAIAGLKKFKGIKIISIGVSTTPMLYFFVNYFRASGGIMITASHNPGEYNGLKVVGAAAVPISGEDIKKSVIGQ